MLRGILFDFNGLLVDDEPVHLELFQRVFTEEGIELSEEDYLAHYLGFDDRGCFEAVLEAVGRPAGRDVVEQLIARKAVYYQTTMAERGFPFFPGALELIDEAARAGLMLGVVTGALRQEVEMALAQVDRRGRFKVVVAADDVEVGKPDPEGYRRGLDLLTTTPPRPERLLHPHEVAAFEDSPVGLQAARSAGLVTLGVAHTYPIEQLSGADATVPSLDGARLDGLLARLAEAARY